MEDAKNTFAGRLRQYREWAKLSQQGLATLAGMSVSSLAQIEQGKTPNPRMDTILTLAKALKVKPGKLLDGLES